VRFRFTLVTGEVVLSLHVRHTNHPRSQLRDLSLTGMHPKFHLLYGMHFFEILF
jgi:hypothetical protein